MIEGEMENLPIPVAKTPKPLHLSQTIQFTGLDDNNSAEVYCEDVTIFPSSGKHESGSSKIKLKNIVDFSWEMRFYTGQLLAVHVAGKYVAYGIKSLGKTSGIVRVVNRGNNERSLLKGMEGMVQDIAFAHIPTQVVLACVDEFGNLLVHQVDETDGKMICTLLLHVEHAKETIANSSHRVIWCPYIPEEEADSSTETPYEDVAKLLVLTHGSKAELWNVGVVTAHHGVGPLRPENVEVGYLEVNEHTQPIVDAAFSPDGTALATASLDGDVKFFQVYMHNGGKPRCLHQWQPHDGKPLSSLFFLDNHKTYNPDVQFWKFAITGAENNSELKIWSCESWSCLQIIRFTPDPSKSSIVLKAGLDLGAGYLLLSDIFNKLLYVLQLYKDPGETCAFVRTASEFLLPYPILSFGIVDAGLRNFKSTSLEDLCNEEGDEDSHQFVQAVVIRMYLVQPKSLQECHIAFQPPVSPEDMDKLSTLSQDSLMPIAFQPSIGTGVTVTLSTLLQDSLMFREGFSDLSLSVLGNTVPEVDPTVQDLPANHLSESQQPANRNSQQQQLNLMTPDAFSSPAKKDSPTELLSPLITHHSDASPHVTRILDASISASPTLIPTITSPIENVLALAGSSPKVSSLGAPLATSELQEVVLQREGFASGGSSPSREVQEILSLKSSDCLDHDFFDDKAIGVAESDVELPPKPTSPKETQQFDVSPLATKKEVNVSILHPRLPPMPTPPKDTPQFDVLPLTTKKEVNVSILSPRLPPMPTPPKDTPQFDSLPKEKASGAGTDGWPQIPMSLVTDVRKSVAAEENSNKRNSTGLPERTPTTGGDADTKNQLLLKLNHKLEGTVTTLVEQMNTLMDIMREQQSQIKELRVEVKAHRVDKERERVPTPRLESMLAAHLDKALATQHQQHAAMLDSLLGAVDEKERKRQEATMSAVSQVIGNLVASKLEDVVAGEIKSNIIPAIIGSMDPLKHQLHVELTQKLTSTDHLLKENITKLVQSKSVMEVLSNTLVSAVQPVMQNCFKDIFTSMVLPNFEKSCQTMFVQLNDSFSKGTKEYVQTLDGHVEKQRRQQEKSRELMGQLQTLSESLRTSHELMSSVVQKEVQAQVQKGLTTMQERLNKTVCEAVKEHIAKGFRAQQAVIEDSVITAVRSRAVTPAPHILDSQVLQAQVLQLIAQGQINTAFQQALSASDLNMVVFVCEKVNPQQVFNQTPCPLQQNVLLSLIQQLSADMTNHTEIKHKYLEEAVMNLDPKNPVTREHMPGVINNLQRQLSTYITNNPNNKITRSMKMLHMATQSLLSS